MVDCVRMSKFYGIPVVSSIPLAETCAKHPYVWCKSVEIFIGLRICRIYFSQRSFGREHGHRLTHAGNTRAITASAPVVVCTERGEERRCHGRRAGVSG